MAGQSATAKFSFMILGWCMIAFGGLFGLLGVLFTFLKNPLTAFKKIPRDGMLGVSTLHIANYILCHISPSSPKVLARLVSG